MDLDWLKLTLGVGVLMSSFFFLSFLESEGDKRKETWLPYYFIHESKLSLDKY